jgi:organic radical activating enzyme
MSLIFKAPVLKVTEIFYSVQGEGARIGIPSIFIRLAGCNLNCWFCDTDWSESEYMTVDAVVQEVAKYPCRNIVWTGGEPTLQLTNVILKQFPKYHHSIETNGTNPVPTLIDYIACSPKGHVTVRMLHDNFPQGVGEFRFLYESDSVEIPSVEMLPVAEHYFISPLFLGEEKKRFLLDEEKVRQAVDFVKQHDCWRLSIQIHKIINVP